MKARTHDVTTPSSQSPQPSFPLLHLLKKVQVKEEPPRHMTKWGWCQSRETTLLQRLYGQLSWKLPTSNDHKSVWWRGGGGGCVIHPVNVNVQYARVNLNWHNEKAKKENKCRILSLHCQCIIKDQSMHWIFFRFLESCRWLLHHHPQ